MKKLIISSVLGVMIAASTAFGQGYFAFTGSTRGVWDVYSQATPLTDSGFATAFLWAPSTVTSAGVDAILPTVATNNSTSYSYTTAWSDIMNDPSFVLAASNTAPGNIMVQQGAANGSYILPGNWGVPNTAASTTYSLLVIAWSTDGGLYMTPSAASGANEPVGWSSVFNYTPSAIQPPVGTPPVSGPGINSALVFLQFPELTTLALAGLGGISMLFLRRRKA